MKNIMPTNKGIPFNAKRLKAAEKRIDTATNSIKSLLHFTMSIRINDNLPIALQQELHNQTILLESVMNGIDTLAESIHNEGNKLSDLYEEFKENEGKAVNEPKGINQ